MKIYTKLVMDMLTLEVLEEESFEYDGPLALCEDGGDGGSSGDGDGAGDGNGAGGDSDGSDGSGSDGDSSDADADNAGDSTGANDGDTDAAESDSDQGGDRGGGDGIGEADVAGLAKAVAQMQSMQNPTNTDFSSISVGPELAAAMARDQAAKDGKSAAEQDAAAAAASAGYAGRNPGMYGTTSLSQMIGNMQRSSIGRAIANAMDSLGLSKDKDVSVAHDPMEDAMSMNVDPANMMSMNVDPANMQTTMSPQDMAGFTSAQRAAAAVNNAQLDFGFLTELAGKFGKKGVTTGLTATALGAPAKTAAAIGFNAALSATPAMALGPAISAISQNFSAREDATAAMQDMAMANPEMSPSEIAAEVSQMTGVDIDSVSNMQSGLFGGQPEDNSPSNSGAQDVDPSVGRTSSQDQEQQAPGGDYDMVPYNMSPLKQYLQSLYGANNRGGYMTDPYASSGGGAYGFRY